MTALRARAARPYPAPLRLAIVAKNHPLLRTASFSYRTQIAAALARNDAVAVQHRLTAFFASFFDVLFALNRQPHPGEKRLVRQAQTLCPLLPADFARQVDALLAAASPLAPDNGLVPRLDALTDGLDALLRGDGLIPLPPRNGDPAAPAG